MTAVKENTRSIERTSPKLTSSLTANPLGVWDMNIGKEYDPVLAAKILKSKCPPTLSSAILIFKSKASTTASTGSLKKEMISPMTSTFLLTPAVEMTAFPHVLQSIHATLRWKASPTLPEVDPKPLITR